MKKILFALVATLAFVGCSKDQNGNDNQMLIGKWECIEVYEKEDGEWVVSSTYGSGETWVFDGEYLTEHDGGSWAQAPYSYNAGKKTLTIMGSPMSVELSDTELITYTEDPYFDDNLVEHYKEVKAVYKKIE